MERYSSYKDSGEKWLGEIPGHWEMVRNKSFFSERKKCVGDESQKYTLLSLTKKGVIVRNPNDGGKYPTDFNTYKIVKPGDFVFCLFDVDETPRTIGLAQDYGMITGAYTILRQNKMIDKYLLYYYLSIDNQKALKPLYTGLRKVVQTSTFMAMKICMPPLPEQRAIVTYLDRVTGDIDRAIEESQKMIDLLNERKQIIIQHAVTKGLNNNAKLKYSGVEWIGEVPEGWECLPLKRCVTFINTKAQEHDKPRISLENIESWTGRYVQTESQYEGSGIQFLKNDILFGKLRPYLAKVYLSQMNGEALGDFWVLRANERVTPQYLQQILLSHQFIYLVDSSTYGAKMPRADWKTNSKIMIPIPTIAEQADIVEHISKHCENISQAIASAERKIALLRERKQIIINEVVTGKVKVS